MLQKILRWAFALLGAITGYLLAGPLIRSGFLSFINESMLRDQVAYQIGIYGGFVLIFGIIFYILFPVVAGLIKKISKAVEESLRGVRMMDVVLGIVGLIIGLLIAMLISSALALIPIRWLSLLLTALVYVLAAYLGVTIPLQRRDEFQSYFLQLQERFDRDRDKEKKEKDNDKEREKRLEGVAGKLRISRKKAVAKPKLLDTSVIIDGRIGDILRTGFIEGQMIIPVFVVGELQLLADHGDDLKRARGRRGLDIIADLQTEFEDRVEIREEDYDDLSGVDEKLLHMAKQIKATIVTNDYNLNKVAGVRGISVLNINELANAVKPVVLPGEVMHVQPVKNGKEAGQAVAFLEDGTMIVVENGRKLIGQDIDVDVTTVLQTAAGRMIFARPKSAEG